MYEKYTFLMWYKWNIKIWRSKYVFPNFEGIDMKNPIEIKGLYSIFYAIIQNACKYYK